MWPSYCTALETRVNGKLMNEDSEEDSSSIKYSCLNLNRHPTPCRPSYLPGTDPVHGWCNRLQGWETSGPFFATPARSSGKPEQSSNPHTSSLQDNPRIRDQKSRPMSSLGIRDFIRSGYQVRNLSVLFPALAQTACVTLG